MVDLKDGERFWLPNFYATGRTLLLGAYFNYHVTKVLLPESVWGCQMSVFKAIFSGNLSIEFVQGFPTRIATIENDNNWKCSTLLGNGWTYSFRTRVPFGLWIFYSHLENIRKIHILTKYQNNLRDQLFDSLLHNHEKCWKLIFSFLDHPVKAYYFFSDTYNHGIESLVLVLLIQNSCPSC